MRFLYSTGILFYSLAIYLASPFNNKAKLWIRGRSGWKKTLSSKIGDAKKLIWVHCASLGEFEQGRPVMESIKTNFPEYQILLTFFSPSGYEIRKNWEGADHICYLPADTITNAERFVEITKPSKVFFVKYEFWNNYISAIHRRGIPLYLISGIFRPQQPFFRWAGGFFRKMIRKFTHIYVQDEESLRLLSQIGVTNATVTGDTRFDRVKKIAGEAAGLPIIETFCGDEKVIVAGSSWPQDEEIIIKYINEHPGSVKWIIAPHETNRINIERIESRLKVENARYSDKEADCIAARVMIIDNVGILSSIYRYAFLAVIGGGFGKGIHNVLEPACWGIPVLFGPVHTKFREAVELIEAGGAAVFRNNDEFGSVIDRWLSDDNLYREAAKTAGNYVLKNSGATARIINEFI